MERFEYIIVLKNLLLFKQWSRKKFAILCSLGKIIRIGVLCVSYSLVNHLPIAVAQPDSITKQVITQIQQVEVTGFRNQDAFSQTSRIITVIQKEDIEKAGIQNLQDLLEYTSNIDIRQRGLLGVQSDMSIRGGSFDQTLVLINGISMSDPQTGHASLDVPIDKECIERIEILEGSAARILGPGAFTGAINIVTRQGTENRLSISQNFGSYGFRRSNINASFKKNNFRHFLSAGISRSKGYIRDTDFSIKNAFYRGNYLQNNTQIDFQAGFQDKDFGAAEFYSPRFPNQYEQTGLWFASVRASAGDKLRISPSVYVRRRRDHFVLDRDNPSFYENFHLTNIAGSQLNLTWHTGQILTTAGIDVRSENILSNNLGFDNLNPIAVRGADSAFYTKRYGRDNLAYFQEHNFSQGKLDVSGGIMINWNSSYPDKLDFFPGFDISYRLMPFSKIYFSFNRGLNFPTFTDLFYTDPVNQGNILLSPDRLLSFEGGFRHTGENVNASVTVFRNTGKDIIDWLWSFAQQRFSPLNLKDYWVNGLETSIIFRTPDRLREVNPVRIMAFNYIFMDVRKSVSDSVSKYYNLKHKISLMLRHGIARRLEATWTVCYQDRSGEIVGYNQADSIYNFTPYKPYWLLDGSLNWDLGSLVIYAMLNNILNTDYIDAGSVTQPGRWFKAGITVNLGKLDRRSGL